MAYCLSSLLSAAPALVWIALFSSCYSFSFPMGFGFILAFFISEPRPINTRTVNEWDRLKKPFTLSTQTKGEMASYCQCPSRRNGKCNSLFLAWFHQYSMALVADLIYRVGQNLIGIFSFWFAGKVIQRFFRLRCLLASTTIYKSCTDFRKRVGKCNIPLAYDVDAVFLCPAPDSQLNASARKFFE